MQLNRISNIKKCSLKDDIWAYFFSKYDLQIKFSMSCVKKRFLMFVVGFISGHEGFPPWLLIEPNTPFSGASMNPWRRVNWQGKITKSFLQGTIRYFWRRRKQRRILHFYLYLFGCISCYTWYSVSASSYLIHKLIRVHCASFVNYAITICRSV